jgi:carbon monoxide dehydrogenase subunit G
LKVQEQFVVAGPASTVWEFFEQVDRVARCVPGVEDVTVVDDENSRVRVTQAVGPMTATFDMKMRITEREPGRSMEFTGIGRSIRGAAGNVRSTNRVQLEEVENGHTRVLLESDVALGGMLGSVGQKVVAKQASAVTKSFARTLEQELSGGESEAGKPAVSVGGAGEVREKVASPGAAGSPASTYAPASEVSGSRRPAVTPIAIAGVVLVAILLILRRVRSR